MGRLGWLFAIWIALTLASCGGAKEGRTFLSIGTGGTGGVYYPLGGALANRLALADPDRHVTAEVTGGSVENINRLRTGQIDLGFALAVSVVEAYTGGGPGSAAGTDAPSAGETPASFTDLRVVAPLYPNLTQVLVRSGLGIETLTDLRGRRVSVGSAGSGTEQVARQVLAAWGLSYDDVQQRYLSFSESAAGLRDGALDGAILSVGYPAAAVLEALSGGGVELLPLDEAGLGRLRGRHPYYDEGRIPSGVYPGMDEPVRTASMMNWIVARADLADAVVEDLLNILGPERVSLERTHAMVAQIDLSALERAPAPLHRATAAWQVR